MLRSHLVAIILALAPLATVEAQEEERGFKFRSEERDRTELAEAVIKGMIPLNRVPLQVSNAEKAIYKALEAECTISCASVPLKDILHSIAVEQDLQIWINEPELELLGVDSNFKFSLKLAHIKLRSALVILLEQFDLTFIVRNGVLEITSIDSAESDPQNEVYRLPDRLAEEIDAVMNIIQQTVDPDSWLVNGGTNTILPLKHLLIVSAPQTTHYKVQELLSKIIDKLALNDELSTNPR